MGATYTRQSTYADGDTINADDTNDELVSNSTTVPQHWVFEYVDAFFNGLDADYYVNGTAVCSYNFQRAEENLYYMNNYLADNGDP